jgi:hypothetical protein
VESSEYQRRPEDKFSFGLWTVVACGLTAFSKAKRSEAKQWNSDQEIHAILKEINVDTNSAPWVDRFGRNGCVALFNRHFDKNAILKKRLPYERLDQLTLDILLGVR